MKPDLELEKIIAKIKKEGCESVLIQLPDGLKPESKGIADRLESETGAKVYIFLGSCFGACDMPKMDVDLIVQFGHSDWRD